MDAPCDGTDRAPVRTELRPHGGIGIFDQP